MLKRLERRIPKCLRDPVRWLIIQIVRQPPVRTWYAWRLHRLARVSPVCLHLGCGSRHFPGWIQIDLLPQTPMPDVLLDLRQSLPLPDQSVEYIYSEDLIEHLDYEDGQRFIAECARVLKPGGVMRILTPNLRSFAQAYLNRSADDLAMYHDVFGVNTFAEMFNLGMRAWGHRFLYDEETLTAVLQGAGFQVEPRLHGLSEEPLLRGLDSRSSTQGAHTMYFDCYKRKASSE